MDEPFLETLLRDPAAELLALVLELVLECGCACGSVLLLLLLLLLLPPPTLVGLLLPKAAAMSAAVAAGEWGAVARRLRELVRTCRPEASDIVGKSVKDAAVKDG